MVAEECGLLAALQDQFEVHGRVWLMPGEDERFFKMAEKDPRLAIRESIAS